MKNFKMFGLIAFLVIISCSDTKENAYLPNTSIVNEWTLINTSGTIAGINHAFPSRTILWKFNENNTLTVINNNTNENLQSGFPSGTYTYNVANNANGAVCNKKITINTLMNFYASQLPIPKWILNKVLPMVSIIILKKYSLLLQINNNEIAL